MSAETNVKKEYQALLTPWKIGNCEIKNRFVVTSMGGTDLFGWMERNHFDKEGARFILEAAKGGAGLVLPGCQPVYNPMFGTGTWRSGCRSFTRPAPSCSCS